MCFAVNLLRSLLASRHVERPFLAAAVRRGALGDELYGARVVDESRGGVRYFSFRVIMHQYEISHF